MSNATTIRPEEAAHFGKLAAEWWDPKGSSAMLHRLNPVRLRFIREAIDAHWPENAGAVRAGGQAGAGCGLRRGAAVRTAGKAGRGVTGVDAAGENIAARAPCRGERAGDRLSPRRDRRAGAGGL
jgi:2-polyprenyl-6-hydroxyphenyl methylase/3-demethylubiquinone-9 3-methyltransferase